MRFILLLQILTIMLCVIILVPVCGIFSIILFVGYSQLIIYLLNFINIRPNHYKYINYKKLKILSSRDYISEWNIVPQEHKPIDKKNATIAYFIFMFCGFLATTLFILVKSFIRKFNITFLLKYDESLSGLAIFVIFFVLILLYYLFDYIYGFITPKALNDYIDGEINESQCNKDE